MSIHLYPPPYIEFIAIQTNKGFQMKWGKPGDKPAATFKIGEDETVLAAFEYCNLHGLWMATTSATEQD